MAGDWCLDKNRRGQESFTIATVSESGWLGKRMVDLGADSYLTAREDNPLAFLTPLDLPWEPLSSFIRS